MNGISKCLLVAQLLVLAHWLHRIAGVDDNSLTTTATTVEITHNNNNNSSIDGSSEFNFLISFLIQFNPYCVSAFTGNSGADLRCKVGAVTCADDIL